MTSSLPSNSSSSNPADKSQGQDNIDERASPFAQNGGGYRTQSPCSMIHEILHPFSPGNAVTAEPNLWNWPENTSPPSPQISGLSG